MVEIYSYDVTSHERFARDQQEIEAFRLQYHLPPSGARFIALQTKVLDFIPKRTAVDVLFQVYQKKTWSRFEIPKNFHNQRFLSSYVAPSLGGREKQDADIQRIDSFLKKKTAGRAVVRSREEREEEQSRREKDDEIFQMTEEEQAMEEGELIIDLLEKGVKETNEMVEYIIARMHQFIQA